jgi:hypothetical protein
VQFSAEYREIGEVQCSSVEYSGTKSCEFSVENNNVQLQVPTIELGRTVIGEKRKMGEFRGSKEEMKLSS